MICRAGTPAPGDMVASS